MVIKHSPQDKYQMTIKYPYNRGPNGLSNIHDNRSSSGFQTLMITEVPLDQMLMMTELPVVVT